MKITISLFCHILVKECGESSSHWSATSEDDVTHYHAYTQTTSDSAAGQTSEKHETNLIGIIPPNFVNGIKCSVATLGELL